MHKGSKEYTTDLGAVITIRASGTFCAFAMDKGKRSLILGPLKSTARSLSYKLPSDISRIYIKTDKSTEYTLTWTNYNRSEVNDNTPLEIPIGYQQPESLASQMRRFIRDEVSSARESDQGSFEEEDDFNDDDEPLSQYELTDMQETYESELLDPYAENNDLDAQDESAKHSPAKQSLVIEDDANPVPPPVPNEGK